MSLENPMQNSEDEVDAALTKENMELVAAEQARHYHMNEEGDILPPESSEKN